MIVTLQKKLCWFSISSRRHVSLFVLFIPFGTSSFPLLQINALLWEKTFALLLFGTSFCRLVKVENFFTSFNGFHNYGNTSDTNEFSRLFLESFKNVKITSSPALLSFSSFQTSLRVFLLIIINWLQLMRCKKSFFRFGKLKNYSRVLHLVNMLDLVLVLLKLLLIY